MYITAAIILLIVAALITVSVSKALSAFKKIVAEDEFSSDSDKGKT